MSQNIGVSRSAEAAAARVRLDRLSSEFTDWFEAVGAIPLAPEPSVPTSDRTILFTNSAVVPFKPYIKGHRDLGGWVMVKQPCIRSQNLHAIFLDDFHTEFMLHFDMLGVMAPARQLENFTEAVASYFADCLGLPASKVAFKVAAEHRDLSSAWQAAWSGPVSVSGESETFYNWTFGDRGMTGRGATFCIVQPDGHWRDLGNLIAFEWHGNTVAYGFGLGAETLSAGLSADRWVIDSTPEGRLASPTSPQEAKLADLAGLVVRLYQVGIAPSNRAQGYVMRKTIVYLERIARELGVTDDELIDLLSAIGQVEAPETDAATRFRADLVQVRSGAAQTRSVDLSFLCDVELAPEALCAAVEEVSLPGALGLEAEVIDVWQGPSLPADRRSVTLTVTITTADQLRPDVLRENLRLLVEELTARLAVALRGTV